MGRPRVVKNVSHNFDLCQGKLGEAGRSNYASTYIRHKNYSVNRPRMVIPPIQTQNPYMDLQTTNMKTYIPHGFMARQEMIRPQERGVEGDEPFTTDTIYMEEYKRKSPSPNILSKPSEEDKAKAYQKAKFSSKTTNKDFFKDHGQCQPTQRFGELPTFTRSLLFPERENLREALRTRTQLDYPFKTVRKPDLIRGAEPTIKVGEGDQYHETTQQQSFKFIPSVPKIHSKSAREPEKRVAMSKMEDTTRYKSDYGVKEKYCRPRKAVVPAPDTLEIRMDNRQRIATEQREQFHGWDVKTHKRPDPAKLPDNSERSDDPMATETTMQCDFAKHAEVPRRLPQANPEKKFEPNPAKFQDATTNKAFFQDWGTNRRLRHGDFHEACNETGNYTKVKNRTSAEAMPISTTHRVFVKKTGRPRTSMKPDYKTIDTTLENDFKTVTRMTYSYPPASAYVSEDFVVKC